MEVTATEIGWIFQVLQVIRYYAEVGHVHTLATLAGGKLKHAAVASSEIEAARLIRGEALRKRRYCSLIYA